MLRHFLRITDLSKDELLAVFKQATALKKELKKTGGNKPILERKTMAMIFEKPSLRTRISFEIGMTQLGGHALYLGPNDIQMGQRESAHDIGIVTSSMADIIMARTFKHGAVEELAAGSSVPVINALTDLEHPCQILADYLTIQEKFGRMTDLKLAFVGDGNNNVTNSLVILSMILGNQCTVAAPKGYALSEGVRKLVKKLATKYGGTLIETEDPKAGVKGVDAVVADTWVSMGAESEKEQRLRDFAPYQVTGKLMAEAKKSAIFMHCLPAYRGKEVAAEVIDGPQSVVFPEAENRLHAQKGLIAWLMKQ